MVKAPTLSAKRRWLQFNIRMLFALTTVASVTLFWVPTEFARIWRQRDLISTVTACGGTCDFDYEFDSKGSSLRQATNPVSPIFLATFGSDAFAFVDRVQFTGEKVTDNDVRHVAGFVNLRELVLVQTNISIKAFEHLESASKLESLVLVNCRNVDGGDYLTHLRRMDKLKRLHLEGANLTDANLRHLKNNSSLQDLVVEGPGVTNAGLVSLKELSHLKILVLRNTNATEEGVAHLKTALPGCKIFRVFSRRRGQR